MAHVDNGRMLAHGLQRVVKPLAQPRDMPGEIRVFVDGQRLQGDRDTYRMAAIRQTVAKHP